MQKELIIGWLAVQAFTGFVLGGDLFGPPSGRVEKARSLLFFSAPDLDLGLQTTRFCNEFPAIVPLGPSLVAGEGPSESNRTIIRVYNRYQAKTAQFLAFSPSVRGGVQVAGARLAGEDRIVAAPINCNWVREVRVFSKEGDLIKSIPVLENVSERVRKDGLGNRSMKGADPAFREILPPFAIATGKFVKGVEDEQVAVASRIVRGSDMPIVRIYSLDTGAVLAEWEIPWKGATLDLRRTQLAVRRGSGHDSVIVQEEPSGRVAILNPLNGALAVESPSNSRGVAFGPVFPGEALSLALPGESLSEISLLDGSGKKSELNVGERENRLYYSMPDREMAGHGNAVEGRYIKPAIHAHWRFDHWPGKLDPAEADQNYWALDYFNDQRISAHFPDPKPTNFQPGFINGTFDQKDLAQVDPERGVNAFLQQDADNKTKAAIPYMPYGELTEKFYFWRFRSMARNLAVDIRRTNPDLNFIGMSPMHEIGSGGDYNPQVIRDFRTWLLNQYGSIGAINRRFGTAFSESSPGSFDAPRNRGRGEWDGKQSDFTKCWSDFNRYTVMTMQARGYRECLLAGFPPEALKGHMIPDTYVWGTEFTGNNYVSSGGCPIEYMLSSGASFGATRYALNYKRPFDWLQGTHTSGHNMVINGEYGVYTEGASEEAEQQTKWLFDNGLFFLLYTHPEGMFGARETVDALAKINKSGEPRPGVTGGVGQIVGAMVETRDYKVQQEAGKKASYTSQKSGETPVRLVSLGEGLNQQGLIKSTDKNGLWDGIVYLQPFHARVEVLPLVELGTNPSVSASPATEALKPTEPEPFRIDKTILAQTFGLFHGDQIEVRCVARRIGDASARLMVAAFQDASNRPPNLNRRENVLWLDAGVAGNSPAEAGAWIQSNYGGYTIPGAEKVFEIDSDWKEYRFTFVNGLTTQALQFLVSQSGGNIEFQSFDLTIEREMAARAAYGILSGEPHQGGVRFDVLSRDSVARTDSSLPEAWKKEGLKDEVTAAQTLVAGKAAPIPVKAGDPVPARVLSQEQVAEFRNAIVKAEKSGDPGAAETELAQARSKLLASPTHDVGFEGKGPGAHPFFVIKGEPSWVAGKEGKPEALEFREVSDAIRANGVEFSKNGTIEIRLKLPRTIYNHGSILSFAGAELYGYWLDYRSLAWKVPSSKDLPFFGSEPENQRYGPALDPTKWYLVSLVKEGAHAKVFVDAKEVSSGVVPNDWPGKSAITIGGGRKAIVDEVRIWSDVKTPEQIAANANKRLTGSEAGLIAVWNFENPGIIEKK